ncbi:MAG: substrate-binding domain-containing protein [Rhodospirillales bacterium]|nr:substrate-binding domain-containing protein [Rhodospirillales bacterium]
MRILPWGRAALALLCVLAWSGTVRAEVPAQSPAGHVAASDALAPPWQAGRNDGAAKQGFVFTVPPVDDLADFHGDLDKPALVLFVAGNYYFAMAPLVAAFGAAYPQYRGHVFYETLPPGILEQQMRAGGTVTVGNMTWTIKPDVYLAGLKKVRGLIHAGMLRPPAAPYVTNDLTIMVPAGNPGKVTGLADLGRADMAVVMPNPRYEGVARQIKASFVKAGGEALAQAVYATKVQNGMTILTHVHHRQTPLYLMQGLAQAGVTWKSEAIFQEQAGHPISHVDIPAAQNTTAIYAGALVRGAAHPAAGKAWLHFVQSDAAIAIFEKYGFRRYQPAK